MKLLVENCKWTFTIFFGLLMFVGTPLFGDAVVTPVSERTPEVRDAIVATVPGINAAADVTEAHLAAITTLNLRGKNIATLKAEDFEGLTALSDLNLYNNRLSRLPDGIFEGLTALRTLRLGGNAVDPLPIPVALEKVAEGQFKAVAPIGATFDYVVSITTTNGSIAGGATTVRIPRGRVASEPVTVRRTLDTTGEVTVAIAALPRLPSVHYGYTLVISDTASLSIITEHNTTPVFMEDTSTDVAEVINTAPSFYEGDSTTRVVFENTAAGLNIGTPVLATDATDDFLTYTLSGVHAAAFAIDTATGQLQTKAPLDYETQRIYTVNITVADAEFSDTIRVIIGVMDVNDTVPSAGFVPVIERTPEVRDAIVAAVPNATDAATVTEAEVAAIRTLNLRNSGISFLKPGDFSGMTALRNLNLYNNHLESLPTGIFTGLPSLMSLRLGGNLLDPLPLMVFLQRVGPDAFKAVMPTGAPFSIVLPIDVANGGTTSVMIPQGSMESGTFTVVGTGTGTPKVAFRGFPRLPPHHYGYTLAQSTVCRRTEQVAAAVADAVGVENCSRVTELDLAAITSLNLSNAGITALKAGDFDGLLSLTTLTLDGNGLTHLPMGIFSDLISLTHLHLQGNDLRSLPAGVFDGLSALATINLQENALTDLPNGLFDGTPSLQNLLLSDNNLTSLPDGIFAGLTALEQLQLRWNPDAASQLPLVVGLEKVGANRFTAVVPSGAPFEIMLPITVANGSLVDGAMGLLIPQGSVESTPVTLTRTPNTIDAVTVAIETPLPMPPATHNGYVLVASATGPLEVIEQINVPPIFAEGADTRRTLAENVAIGTDVGDPVTATDANKGAILTYSLEDGAFDIDSETGQLKTKAPLDFETQKTYSVMISVSDGELTGTIDVTITVSDVNDAPVFAAESPTTQTVGENTPTGENIGTPYTATDADGDTLTYSLDDGTDANAFDIDSETGQLKTKTALDFETQKTYAVTLTVSDGELTDTLAVTINISDVNEAPVFAAESLTTHTIAENTPSGENIGTPYTATDIDGDALTYSLEGADANAFDIDTETGQLKTKASLDYETKKTYAVTLIVSDGEATGTLAVTIHISDVNEVPVFATESLTTQTVAENTPAGANIGTPYSVTDADGDTVTYSLEGADADAFDIDTETGQIKTEAVLDYETETSYSVTIRVSDGEFTDSIAVRIDVTDVEENRDPVFTEGDTATRTVQENIYWRINIGSAIEATDPDNDALTYTLSGTDADSFEIVSTSGQLKTKATATFDYETKSSYSVTVSVSDGKGGSDSIDVTIRVIDVYEGSTNRAPVFTEGDSTTRAVRENTAVGTLIGTPVSATDVNRKDILTYSLRGPDAASFSIDPTTGQLRTRAILDYETKSSYSVTVSVSDGRGRRDSIDVTITLGDVLEFIEGSTTTRSIAEHTPPGVNIGAPVSATDADTETFTYTLGGPDADSFDIDPATGQLKTRAFLDYETKTSYIVTVSVSDGAGKSGSLTVRINIINVAENYAPRFIEVEGSSTTRSVFGSKTAPRNVGGPVSATDADGDTVTYSLGGTDATLFSIDSATGQLQTSTSLNYNTQTSRTVAITASDNKGGRRSITVTINVLKPVTDRPSQMRSLIVSKISGVSDANDVTEAHLRSITRLQLAGRSIGAIALGDFDGLTGLTQLDLNSNNLPSLPAGIFDQLTQLTQLDLRTNDLTELLPGIFDRLTQLTTLYLRYNGLTSLPPGIFNRLTQLTTLDVGENDLTALPAGIFNRNTQLTRLDVGYNDLTSLPPGVFDRLTQLTQLDVGNNDLTALPAGVFDRLTQLTRLYLLTNDLTALPAGVFNRLTKLERLWLTNNNITDMSALQGVTSLTHLYVRGNPISDYTPLQPHAAAINNVFAANRINLNNNPPTFTAGATATRSIPENTATGTNFGAAIAATDLDTGDTLTYSLGGMDAASFSFNSPTTQLQTKAALDYETKNTYTVFVTVNDGNSGGDRITVTINVTDVNPGAPPVQTPPVIPDETLLLTNYPNPFNPETWIPYQLATPAEVTLTIYDIRGVVVRELKLGHQAAGFYQSRARAIHWDGRNRLGEKVATGLYFYTLQAGDYAATRKLLIRK